MRGLDYKWIEALEAIVTQGSFERAAEDLYISQSAISQRLKQLEKFLAQPALIREQPPRPTLVGKKLLSLHKRVKLLESELIPELANQEQERALSISIATNADSLATWLLPAISPVMKSRKVEMNIVVFGESRTLDKMKSGEVVGAISQEEKPIQGCDADYLGRIDYVCVASPDFVSRYFSDGVNFKTLASAPAVSFDQYDDLHKQFLHQYFNVPRDTIINHTVASSEAFVKLALSGVAYCLIPRLQIESELASGALVDVTPNFFLTHRLYWHHWQLESGLLQEVTKAVTHYAKEHLPQ